MSAEYVMNNPDLRSLIMNFRSDIMFKENHKKNLAKCLNILKSNVISQNSQGTFWKREWGYISCYAEYNGKCQILERDYTGTWAISDDDLYRPSMEF